jgi:hypothetical protein
MPPRRTQDTTTWVDSWDSYAEQQVREAIDRGEFDRLPGAGTPIDLGDVNPFEGDLGPAYRLARNAGVMPGWVALGQEVEACLSTLETLLKSLPRSPVAPEEPKAVAPQGGSRWREKLRRLWLGSPRHARRPAIAPASGGRAIARARFMDRAAHADGRIRAYNSQLPRNLAWLELPRYTPEVAAARFDRAWPPSDDHRR